MMDHRSARDRDPDVDLESGLPLLRDESKKVSSPGTANQGKAIFTKISGGFAGGSQRGEDRPLFFTNESNLNKVSLDSSKVTNKLVMGQDSMNHEEKTRAREKHKKSSNKKALKPPRPPQAPALDAADYKLIREISELAMLKRARTERMKALKKMKAAKSLSSSSSSHSSILAMIFTIIFFLVIILQGMSCGKSHVASFQGSPLSTGAEGGLISVQYQLTPSASESNAPGSESHHSFVQQVTGSDSAEKQRRDSG